MKLAACLIIKDEIENIERVISEIHPHVDGIFIYDTGSTDGSIEAARAAGANVVEGEWRNDFAWARNRSYALPPDDFDWIVYCDADDHLQGWESLRGLVSDALPFVTAFSFPYLNTWGSIQVDYDTIRVIRSNSHIWKWPLHEQLVPVGEQHVVHSDSATWSQVHTLEDRVTHTQRNLDFLHEYAKEHPIDDWLASAIVLTMIEQGRAREAHTWMIENDYTMEITKNT